MPWAEFNVRQKADYVKNEFRIGNRQNDKAYRWDDRGIAEHGREYTEYFRDFKKPPRPAPGDPGLGDADDEPDDDD